LARYREIHWVDEQPMRFTVNDNANASIQNGEDVTASGTD
jgi:hypothetical protein